MLGNQRWRDRRDSYRPPNEVINTRAFDVAPIDDDNTAKRFIIDHHYSGSFPAARFRFGLYHRAQLAGVAVFSHPCNDTVLTNVFRVPAIEAVELGRFVLLDDVPGNGETWFLARCFELLRSHVVGVVSFSDPIPRANVDGRQIFPGHVGTIYQAHNARYLGRGTARTLRVLPDGRVLNDRTKAKIRALHRGWRASVEELQSFGASEFDPFDRVRWLDFWIPKLTRRLRHPGNHKYAWAMNRAMKKQLPASLPYPKKVAA